MSCLFKNQSGQIGFILLIFLFIFLSLFTFKTDKKKLYNDLRIGSTKVEVNTNDIKGCVPFSGANPPVFKGFSTNGGLEDDNGLNPIKVDGKKLPNSINQYGIDPSKEASYQLVLQNVPIRTAYLNINTKEIDGYDNLGLKFSLGPKARITIEGVEYSIMYPTAHGKVSAGKGGGFSPSELGVVFLTHLDPEKKPIVVDGSVMGYKGTYMVTDVYQDISLIGTKPIPKAAIDECQGKNITDDRIKRMRTNEASPSGLVYVPEKNIESKLFFPEQQRSDDKEQLQLEYFLLEQDNYKIANLTFAGAWNTHCKPAIYLYPEKSTNFNVQVFPKGFLTLTIPPYPNSGWSGLAFPNGDIFVNNQKYNYLYYEAKIDKKEVEIPSSGFVIRFEEIQGLLQKILPKLGLNQTQVDDFKSYWQQSLPFSAYYFVGIMDQKNIDYIEPLKITPTPDYINRVHLYFKMMDKLPEEKVLEPKILETKINTNGFKVIEWGGILQGKNFSGPTYCSI